MANRLFFWLDTEFLYFCLAYNFQNSTNSELFAIIDVPNNPKKFFETQDLVKFNQSWYLHDYIKISSEIDYDFLENFEKKYKIDLWQLALNERIFYLYNKFYKFNSKEIISILEKECKLFEKILDDVQPTHFITKQTIQHKDHIFFNMCKTRNIETLVTYVPKTIYGCMISKNLHKMDNLQDFHSIQGKKRGFDDIRKYLQENNTSAQIKKITQNFATSSGTLSAAKEFLLHSDNSSTKTNYPYFGHTKSKAIFDRIKSSSKKKSRYKFIDENLEKIIKDEPFIYFPLPVDQERENLIATPFNTNTLETIRNIAKSIPIKFKLYVKEHPGQSVRYWKSIDEYQKILEIPNVVLFHPSVPANELYEKSSLVISLGGTPGFEAAIFNKPSIIFADLDYSILSSVTKINHIEDLSSAIRESLKKNISIDEIDRYLTLVAHNMIDFDLVGFTLDEYEYFFHEGNLEDVHITIPKMENFLKMKEKELKLLTQKLIKKL